MKKQSAIAWLKARESLDTIVLIADDIDALKILTAWKIQGPMVDDVQMELEPERVEDCVKFIWDTVGPFDLGYLQMLTGLPLSILEVKITKLRESGLIYPDGTIAEGASVLLRRQIKDMLESKKMK